MFDFLVCNISYHGGNTPGAHNYSGLAITGVGALESYNHAGVHYHVALFFRKSTTTLSQI